LLVLKTARWGRKRFPTVPASGSDNTALTSVQASVIFVVLANWFLNEAFAARLASVGLLARMLPHVSVKMTLELIFIRAKCTRIAPRVEVNRIVPSLRRFRILILFRFAWGVVCPLSSRT
jgi:hypothetical protein